MRAAALSSVLLVLSAQVAPGQDEVTIVRPKLSTLVLDRNGGLLGEIGPEARTWVRLVDLPRFVAQAFVATEDRRFYLHDGVDLIGVVGAVRDNILRGFGSRGASTITQQLIGAMYPTEVDRRQITLRRKLREAEMARALERRHNKAEILEAYLNYVHLGHGWYGVEAAARHYFGKHASDLSLPEAALLTALANAPALYDPRAHPDRALRRRNLVLRRMLDEQFVSRQEARAAMLQPVHLAPDDGYSARAPYVVEWVRRWSVERFGLQAVNTGGLAVTTTVDPDLQRAARSALASGLAQVESLAGYRWPRYDPRPSRLQSGRTPYLQGLIAAIDPISGDLLALEGGRDFRHSEFDRATQARRQPGSAFKPLVYAAALSSGLPPTTILADSPLVLERGDGSRWVPENSDRTWSGPVTMRTALVRSLNVPTIRLALATGLDSVEALAHRLGITTPIPRVGSSAIGAAEVRPVELVSAFGVFAALGTYAPLRVITLVQGSAGLPVYEAGPSGRDTVLDPRVAFQVIDMLRDAVARGTGTAALRGLPTQLPVAGKTGTTNENADVWFVGMTPDLVAGVWLGFDRPQTISAGAFGGTLAAPIWGRFAAQVYTRRAIPNAWGPPPGLVTLRVRRSDGAYAPDDSTDAAYLEYFIEGTEPAGPGALLRLARRVRRAIIGW